MSSSTDDTSSERGKKRRISTLSSTTQPTDFDRHFTPSPPGTTDLLLVCSSVIGFYFPRHHLVERSSFFRNVCENSHAAPKSNELVYLPSATTYALRFVLHLLRYLTRDAQELPIQPGERLNEIMIVADAYDLPFVPEKLYTLYHRQLDPQHSPFTMFAYAALSGDERDAKKASKASLTRYLSDMPAWLPEVLNRWAPSYYVRLIEAHRPLHLAHIQFRTEVNSIWKNDDQTDEEFESPLCEEAKCVTLFCYQGEWRNVVLAAAHGCFDDGKNVYPSEASMPLIWAKLDTIIVCGGCNKRIQRAWKKCFDNFLSKCPATI